MPKFLLQLHSSHMEQPFDFCAVDITPKLAQFIAKCQVLLITELKKLNDMALCVEFFDYTPVYYDVLPEAYYRLPGCDVLSDFDSVMRLPDDFDIPESGTRIRVELGTMRIYDDTVHWTVREKHSDVEMETAALVNSMWDGSKEETSK